MQPDMCAQLVTWYPDILAKTHNYVILAIYSQTQTHPLNQFNQSPQFSGAT